MLKLVSGDDERGFRMTPKQALAFVKTNGVVLESARGSVPSLAEAVAGGPNRGSWWTHPKTQLPAFAMT